MRVAPKGTRLSEEHKWKIGLGGLGRLFSEEHIFQYHPENGEEHPFILVFGTKNRGPVLVRLCIVASIEKAVGQ